MKKKTKTCVQCYKQLTQDSIEHYYCKDISDMLIKLDKYSSARALDLLEQKGEDPDMIRLERNSVKALIKTSEKENKKS